ncbi:hypothetical protein JYJ95_28815 [Corallococcus exiguus]|uniref:hypothetical protein n=1 Tax=Corallococcus exiguus TaxID=83462 RepID=UPI001A8F8C58|nr:hypothetical protein [Corallococcus exiguus]MBN8470529.1 hypothetical protein [Corallococcus exiguus]
MPLDPDAYQKTQVYRARAAVLEVLEDLRAMELLLERALTDRAARAAQEVRSIQRRGVGLILAAVVVVVACNVLPPLPGGGWLYMLLFALCFFGGFAGLVMVIVSLAAASSPTVSSSSAQPFPEERRGTQRRLLLTTLLQRFQVDLERDAPVDVKLDVASVQDPRKRVHAGRHGTWDREDFTDPWLSLQGRFVDGTQLSLSVVDQVRTLHREKRNARGRLKRKAKRNGLSLMTVALRVKPERHPGLADLEERARDSVRLPSGVRLKRLRVAEDRVELRVLLEDDWVARPPKVLTLADVPPGEPLRRTPPKTDAARTATMMLLSLYQVLNHSSSQGQPGKMRSTP